MMRRRGLLRYRWLYNRHLLLGAVVVALLLYCLYYAYTTLLLNEPATIFSRTREEVILLDPPRVTDTQYPQCRSLRESEANVDTVTTYPKFDFQPSWAKTKEYWDTWFEERYNRLRKPSPDRPKLKVILVPHSHNDPGWLQTYESYFEWKTKNILNNVVSKLNQYPNMTFIWSEVSFLSAWWEISHPIKQKAMKKLISEGRVEITTGGWVMPDEATTHIYALLDQYIEGHSWLKNNIGVEPKTGWSIDPFGHGPTVPYILDKSGIQGTVIQRIHYAWKQWLAKKQFEDFHWIPGWETEQPSLIVHNQPFDIYSIKSSCGPHPAVCLGYDFRKIPGEFTEYSAHHQNITDANIDSKAKTLMEQYARTGSLTTHNVVLMPLGDDFRYDYDIEFDGQYINYKKLFDYVNSHQEIFNADVMFGTPSDYFQELTKRQSQFPTLKGDFFVYSDIYVEGKAAYWSGFYTTRPFMKILTRKVEHHLRTAEILFSLVYNQIRSKKSKDVASVKLLERSYEYLIKARRHLGLFQHHDAITGTSKYAVMYDYGTKLFTSIYHCLRLQEVALSAVMAKKLEVKSRNILQSETEWESYGQLPKKITLNFPQKKELLLFNSLAESRVEIIQIRSNTPNVRFYDTFRREYVLHQVNPVITAGENEKLSVSETDFDIFIKANLPPLTAVTYKVEVDYNTSALAVLFCNNCVYNDTSNRNGQFHVERLRPGDIQLENSAMKLLINRNTGFLRLVYTKDTNKKNVCEIKFGAYQSAQRHSGAYLFMPDYDNPEKNILGSYSANKWFLDDNLYIVSGSITTELMTMYRPFLTHTLRIYNVADQYLSRAIQIENHVNFEAPPKNRDTELFMRIQTDIQNGENPEFYTDLNGFQYQKRVKIPNLGIEANYYPITTMAWLQDSESRLTLVTDHAQGASAFEPGQLEVMLDRRTLYDDYRGLSEGIVDNRPTLFQHWLLLENKNTLQSTAEREFYKDYELPSQRAGHLSRTLNYPLNVYFTESESDAELKPYHEFARGFPEGIHLLTLRSIRDEILDQSPSDSSFMILHRQGVSCKFGVVDKKTIVNFSVESAFLGVELLNVTAVSLTGLRSQRSLAGLKEIDVQPMELKNYKLTFS